MAFKDFFISKPKTEIVVANKTVPDVAFGATTKEASNFSYQPVINPLMKMNGVYMNGMYNIYPNYINDLCERSALLAAIIEFKKRLTVSNGYTVDDSTLNINEKIRLNQLLCQFDELTDNIAQDLHLVSQFYIEVTWNDEHTKIIKTKYIPHERIRILSMTSGYEEVCEYEYCFDWVNPGLFPKKVYKPFSPFSKDKVQLDHFELRSNGQLIYNRPKWAGGVDWAEVDKSTAEFHTANLNNSMAPSALIELFQKPDEKEAKAKIVQDINDSFGGARKAGRVLVAFNKDPETAMKYTVLDAPKLDKTFVVLSDTIQRQIAFSQGIDPAIIGLRVSSQLGQGVNLKESFKLFDFNQIQPAQKCLEKVLNKYIKINGLHAKIKFNSGKDLFEEGIQKVTAAAGGTSTSATPSVEAVSIEQQAQANLRGSVGGVQGIIQIQTSVSQGITDYSAAIVMLKEIFGFTEEIAKQLLGTPRIQTPTT